MISEAIQRRVASQYMESKLTEEQLNELESVLVDAIWFSDEHIGEDELVRIDVKLINKSLEEDAEKPQNKRCPPTILAGGHSYGNFDGIEW